MPFCHIGVYNKAEIPDLTLSAWADADGCDTSSPAPLYCKAGYCTCLDATTTGSKDAKCSALWCKSPFPPPSPQIPGEIFPRLCLLVTCLERQLRACN